MGMHAHVSYPPLTKNKITTAGGEGRSRADGRPVRRVHNHLPGCPRRATASIARGEAEGQHPHTGAGGCSTSSGVFVSYACTVAMLSVVANALLDIRRRVVVEDELRLVLLSAKVAVPQGGVSCCGSGTPFPLARYSTVGNLTSRPRSKIMVLFYVGEKSVEVSIYARTKSLVVPIHRPLLPPHKNCHLG